MTGATRLAYLEAVAALPYERRSALAAIETCFLDAAIPRGLDGSTRGRLLATTVGYEVDAVAAGLTRVWMPWRGKVFDPRTKEGRNIFVHGFEPVVRAIWPSYGDTGAGAPGSFTTFAFTTWHGPSALGRSGSDVLRVDYHRPDSPWLVRDVLDEVVQIDDGLHLGQVLLRCKGAYRRAASFELRTD